MWRVVGVETVLRIRPKGCCRCGADLAQAQEVAGRVNTGL
jgi:hypothetical protein